MVRCYECVCKACGTIKQKTFKTEPYPTLDDTFTCFCSICNSDQPHSRTATKKARAENNVRRQENDLKKDIEEACKKYGFTCRFLYQSVVISTPLSDWQFDYHQSKKTLYHESTIKINFTTGDYAKSHIQFKERRISNAEIILYIANHEKSIYKLQKEKGLLQSYEIENG